MINPFAGKQPVQLELLIDNAEDMTEAEKTDAVFDTLLNKDNYPTPEEKPTAWQTLLGMVFGDGVAFLPAAPFNSQQRISKRRMRRLRGRAKAARFESNYANQ